MRINMKKKVADILTLKSKSRDNDFYLMYWVWKNEFQALNVSNKMMLDFDRTNIVNLLSLLKDKKLSHPSGIMRARRKLQEDYPRLRGKIWDLRHQEQKTVKADLGYNNTKPTQWEID